jgi:hypothetical protein
MEVRKVFQDSRKLSYPPSVQERVRVREGEIPRLRLGMTVTTQSLTEAARTAALQVRVASILTACLLLAVTSASAASLDEMLSKRKPEAMIDLGAKEGVQMVKGEWRYSDTKIIEVGFRAAGQDGQPDSTPNTAYDFIPHAGRAEFDDSKWEVIDPLTLEKRRSRGRLAFNWYRINITVPERVGTFDPTGSTIVFETSVDDYAEIWVDGELPRAAGQSGGSVIRGWNAANKLIIGRGVNRVRRFSLRSSESMVRFRIRRQTIFTCGMQNLSFTTYSLTRSQWRRMKSTLKWCAWNLKSIASFHLILRSLSSLRASRPPKRRYG